MLQNHIDTFSAQEDAVPLLDTSLDLPAFDLHKVEESLKVNQA